MTKRIWHKGPPPHVGWWNASLDRNEEMWRWWGGTCWSMSVSRETGSQNVALFASVPAYPEHQDLIEWTDYWPENARVPRIDPRNLK